ncbi:hypothetical protein AXF42_Ash020515 [Apostasia shenzhenica]|uniref:Uncharacterized protein n=1 Tax=Apostasia shenzhenica TaxID=1088818 RepID=A0A2H9ZXZ1_9ASPA|nr:hypothetical protein AXF42_Ash020515 [Apostasia shenzhenica]
MRRLCDVSWTHKLFTALGTLGMHVVQDRIRIMSPRMNPALHSHECWIGKFGLLSWTLSWCPRAILSMAAGASH